MEKTKQRISWIDVTKGIAIYLVILGHSLIGLKVNDYIFAFHMPLFFIASGLLFREKSIKKTIAGNIKNLLVPYYITSVCVILGRAVSAYLQGWTVQNIRNLCLNTMIGAVFGYGVDGSKWFFTVWMIGAIWFLWAFFWSDIIIHVVFRYTKNWQEWQRAFLIIGISAVSYIVGQYIWIPTNLDVGGFAILFVYIGYLLQKIRIWEQGKLPWICWILCVIVWVYASHTGGINMVIRAVPNFVVLFGAVAGSVMTMKLAIQLDKIPGISRCLSWFGKNSMKILCVHLFEILILSWDFIEVKCHVPVTRLTTIILRTIFIVVVVLCINGVQGIYKKQKKQK